MKGRPDDKVASPQAITEILDPCPSGISGGHCAGEGVTSAGISWGSDTILATTGRNDARC